MDDTAGNSRAGIFNEACLVEGVGVDCHLHGVLIGNLQGGVDGADGELAAGQVGAQEDLEIAHLAHHRPGTLRQQMTGGGGLHGAAGAGEQAGAQFALEGPHLLRDGGGRQVESAGGLGHRARLDDQQETVQVFGFHDHTFSII